MCKIIGKALPDMPWQERPEGDKSVVWRYSQNPIITKKNLPEANSIFNSAVVPFKNGYIGVFRVDNLALKQCLHVGKSADGIHWELEEEPIKFISEDPETGVFVRGFDPRVCFIEDRYYVSFCNCHGGPTVGLAYTYDFENFYEIGNAFLPFNRNGVLFPRKINGKYAILSRPSDNGHTPFGDVFYSESPDMTYWGNHKEVMKATGIWQGVKIGAGPVPIETDEGWLLIYHGVLLSCNGFTYSAGVALLDLDEPWKVKYRSKDYILAPQELYECVGDVPNVVFPCAALCDADTGRIAIYYGAADTVVAMAYTTADDLIKFVKENSL